MSTPTSRSGLLHLGPAGLDLFIDNVDADLTVGAITSRPYGPRSFIDNVDPDLTVGAIP